MRLARGSAGFGRGDQARHASPFDKLAAHQVARPLGGDERTIDPVRRHHLPEVDVEPVRAKQEVARAQLRLDLMGVDVGLNFIRQEDVDEITCMGRVGGRHRFEPITHRRLVVRRARPLTDDDLTARIAQVLGLGMSLAAVADHRDRLAFEQREVGILVVVHFGSHRNPRSEKAKVKRKKAKVWYPPAADGSRR